MRMTNREETYIYIAVSKAGEIKYCDSEDFFNLMRTMRQNGDDIDSFSVYEINAIRGSLI